MVWFCSSVLLGFLFARAVSIAACGVLCFVCAWWWQAKAVLDAGLVPVLHGDAVLDRVQGSAIVSGDMILDSLCASLRPTAAVFLTDVPGVRTAKPISASS